MHRVRTPQGRRARLREADEAHFSFIAQAVHEGKLSGDGTFTRRCNRWLEEKLGFSNPLTFGPFSDPTGDFMTQLVDVHPRAVVQQIRMLRGGDGPNIELFQYTAPHQNQTWAKNSDFAGHHVALYVTDIAQAVASLEHQPGVQKFLGPFPVTGGPAAGQTINYFKTFFGLYIAFTDWNLSAFAGRRFSGLDNVRARAGSARQNRLKTSADSPGASPTP